VSKWLSRARWEEQSSVADTASLRHAGLPGVSGESHAGGVEAQVQDEHARGG
jgi:hypothetical protein